jgi:hypothetical protein
MARKKDLAGLAALGALGYALSRGKGGSDAAAMDAMTSGEYGGPNAGGDIMTDKEPGWESSTGARRAPTRSLSAAPARAPSRVSVDDEAGMSRGTRARDPRDAEAGMSRGTRSTSMAGAGRGSVNPSMPATAPDMSAYVPRRTPGPLTDVDRPGTRVRYENEDTYKKGGKVKSSSASRRADGIATKGKTRGKIY